MAVAPQSPEAALADRLEQRADELTRTLVCAWRAEIPGFDAPPAGPGDAEVGDVERADEADAAGPAGEISAVGRADETGDVGKAGEVAAGGGEASGGAETGGGGETAGRGEPDATDAAAASDAASMDPEPLDAGSMGAESVDAKHTRFAEHTHFAMQTIRLLLAAVRGEQPDEHDRHALANQATRLAADGLPLSTLLAAYSVCGRVLFHAVRAEARPHEQAAALKAAERLVRANSQITGDAALVYQNEPATSGPLQRDWHRALVRDLLAGIIPALPSLLEEFRLGEGAVVLAVGFGDELVAHEGPTRGMQAVQDAIEVHLGRTVPMLLEADGGHVLVPHPLLPAPQGPALDEIAARIAEIRPSARIAAAAAHSPGEVAAAARTASEVLRLAGRLGRPAGAYRMADVLLEYHLTRRDESAELLDGLLEPLAERPELLETVRVYLEENYDRRRAAQRLSLHPNTVDNRLARTTELTGLDPSTPRGVTLLVTALALRDLG